VTRVLRPPKRIDVVLDGSGLPAVVRIGRDSDRVNVVEQFRVSERWWNDPIDRTYMKVVGSTWIILIFHDLLSGDWFLERIFD
jgi:hypothetical protein